MRSEAVAGLPKELAFPIEEYRDRVGRLRARMGEAGLDVMLVHQPPSVFYLSGNENLHVYDNECVVVPREGEVSLLVPEADLSRAQLTSWVPRIVTFPPTGYTDLQVDASLQLSVYSYATAMNGLGDQEDLRLRFDVLTKTKTPELHRYETTRDQAATRRLYRLAAEVLRAIEAEVFPPRVGWQCGECAFRSGCWAWG